MTKKTVLSADIGTTSLKAALIDDEGKVKAFAKESFEKPDERYIAQKWFSALCSAVKKLIDAAGEDDIAAIGISGNGPTIVSEDGTTLLWNADIKPASIAGTLAAHSLFIPRIAAFRELFPAEWNASPYIYSGPEYLIHKLTGASLTILPEARYESAYWTREQLEAASVPEGKLPPYVPLASDAGATNEEATAALGLKKPVRVFCGGPDFIAAMIGTNTLAVGKIYDRAGSSEGINICTPFPLHEERVRSLPSVIPGLWNASMLQTESGRMFVNYKTIVEAIMEREFSYEELIAYCLEHPESDGFEILSLIAENLHRSFSALLAAAEKNNIRVRLPVVVTGGQTKNEQWMQMKCDYARIPLALTACPDAELIGDAAAAFTGLGVYGSLEEAASSLVKIIKTYKPRNAL